MQPATPSYSPSEMPFGDFMTQCLCASTESITLFWILLYYGFRTRCGAGSEVPWPTPESLARSSVKFVADAIAAMIELPFPTTTMGGSAVDAAAVAVEQQQLLTLRQFINGGLALGRTRGLRPQLEQLKQQQAGGQLAAGGAVAAVASAQADEMAHQLAKEDAADSAAEAFVAGLDEVQSKLQQVGLTAEDLVQQV